MYVNALKEIYTEYMKRKQTPAEMDIPSDVILQENKEDEDRG